MKSISSLFLALALIPFSASAQSTPEPLASLDGTITRSERAAATDSLWEGDTALLTYRDGNLLRIAVESIPIGVASLCIGNSEGVRVLHASAALGGLAFNPGDSGWQTSDRFAWSVRDTTMSTEALAERREFLEQNGWAASTTAMGAGHQAEFLILLDRLPPGAVFVSLGVMPRDRPETIVGLPSATAGDCALADLVQGMVPATALAWDPAAWKRIVDG